MSALCIVCNMEFATEAEFQAHKKSGHEIPGKPIAGPGVPPEIAPTPEFLATVARIEAKNEEKLKSAKAKISTSGKNSRSSAPQGAVASESEPKQVISLHYTYRGACQEHGIEVETYFLSAGGKYFAVAVCPADKKQLKETEVVRLD